MKNAQYILHNNTSCFSSGRRRNGGLKHLCTMPEVVFAKVDNLQEICFVGVIMIHLNILLLNWSCRSIMLLIPCCNVPKYKFVKFYVSSISVV